MGKNGVDGVYTADPAIDKSAIKLDHITYNDVLLRGLKVADATAFNLCMDNDMPMVVFGMDGTVNVTAALRGDTIGTLVSSDDGAYEGLTNTFSMLMRACRSPTR